MTVDDLIAFINARLDEDEQAARAATPGPWVTIVRTLNDQGVITDQSYPPGSGYISVQPVMSEDETHHRQNAEHIARHDPARALRQVQALRAIVSNYNTCATADRYTDQPAPIDHFQDGLGWALQQIAATWSDHPDYRPDGDWP